MNEISLFDYQQEMVRRVQEAFRTHRSVMVQMPTGTGKTYLLAAIVKGEERSVKKPCVWIVAHRRELVAQIIDTLKRFSLSPDATNIKVMSIQWLTLHYREMKEAPSLLVIDEAHHAVAETYAQVMRAFPEAKKLGLTATPCRLSGKGFTDLFDVLLSSWSMERFIAEGRLSLYDYYSIRPDSVDQQLIHALKKRGADGDYQLGELAEVMDVRPSLERLCMTVQRYVPGKKGIVYAISIAHAEHIAEFYRGRGIRAVAISSKTPAGERKEQIAQFKRGEIQVLVSVDLFSEGFDCPDVEFVQLARPTLSLSKYLQMVGRGLRVTRGKDYCVVLDNVGLYRCFGLPSDGRDWQRMFEGRTTAAEELREVCMHIDNIHWRMEAMPTDGGEMECIVGHDRQRQTIRGSYGYKMVTDAVGRKGIADRDGATVVACEYAEITLLDDSFAYAKKGVAELSGLWIDLRNGLHFDLRPQSIRFLGIDFSTCDGKRLYPRIRSPFIDDKAYLSIKTLELQVGSGLSWKRRFIPWAHPDKVYLYQGGAHGLRLYVDEEGNYVAHENIGSPLVAIASQEQMDKMCRECAARQEQEMRVRQKLEASKRHPCGEESNESLVTRGFVRIQRTGGWCYVTNIPGLRNRPLREWEIVADENLCVIRNEYLFLRQEPRQWYKIMKRTDDFSYFVVREHEPGYKTHIGLPDITITQFGSGGVKLEKNGLPYMPD